jgi:hypothetical protein
VNRDPAQRFRSAGLAASELAGLLGVVTEPLDVGELPHRSPIAAQSAVAAASPRSAQLETQELAVLSSSPGLIRSSSTRAGLAALGIVLAGAGAAVTVLLGKRAGLGEPALSALPASAALPAARGLTAAPSPAPPVATPSALPVTLAPSSAQSLPTPSSAGKSRRLPGSLGKTPPKAAGPARDPYEQR